VRITVERLGHLGDGIGREAHGAPVYVTRALPGEVVEGEVVDGRMADPAILVPSPDRVRAPCPHYGACGGCSLMHASDGFVANWKTALVRDSMAREGLDAPIRPILTSPALSRRRAAFSVRRTRKGAVAGFHGQASGTLVAVRDCCLVDPALAALLPVLERIASVGASRARELKATATETASGIDLAVEGGKPLEQTLFSTLSAIIDGSGVSRLSWDGEPVAMSALPAVKFGPARVAVPPGGFLQATLEGEEALAAAVVEATAGAGRIADLFAGSGTFALRLARAAEVHAVEADGKALAALSEGWREAAGLRRVTTERRDLYRRPLLPEELDRFEAVVIDPPRAGAEAQVREVARSRLRRLAAVSCNPATFARDAAILTGAGFRVEWVQPVDQFRWSGHVELAALLSR
jgi:23S rRNA (uracil1939-C5)-methyltransferase